MPRDPNEHIGARIARTRKLRNLTQRQLAARANLSYSTITKVEQGAIPASPSVIGACARALSLSVPDLTGLPYLDELRADQLDGLLQPIREALNVYDLGPDPDITPRGLDELHTEAEGLCAMVRATDIKQAAAALPALIGETTTAAHAAPSTRAWQILASTYRTAYDVASKLGFMDLAAVALDRLAWAAERASDPVLGGMRQYMRALAYLRASEYRTGHRLIGLGMGLLDQAEPSRELDVVRGQLHLGAAVLAARDKDGDAANGHLAEAERIACGTGRAEKVHWLSFGPTNVGVHRVSVQAELDEYGRAVETAQAVSIPSDWPPSRIAHHHAEVARAQVWTGQADAAFKSLLAARKVAPQQTKYHPLVRETVAVVAHARRQTPNTLSNYVHWLGL
jgi:transcriptional regulator with XRE-family HTH domain